MIDSGDKIHYQQESRTIRKLDAAGAVKDLPRSGRLRTMNENIRQNVMLCVENPHDSVRSLVINFGSSYSTVH